MGTPKFSAAAALNCSSAIFKCSFNNLISLLIPSISVSSFRAFCSLTLHSAYAWETEVVENRGVCVFSAEISGLTLTLPDAVDDLFNALLFLFEN